MLKLKSKMNKSQVIAVLFLITSFSVFGQKKEWNTLNEKDYSIQHPKSWELNKSGQMGTSFILLSQLSSDSDTFKENVNLIIQDLSAYKIDLNKYVEISKAQIKKLITDPNIVSSTRMKNKGVEFHKIVYTGKQGVFDLKFMQYYWVQNNKAYVLTFTSEKAEFDNIKDIGEKILNSFIIK